MHICCNSQLKSSWKHFDNTANVVPHWNFSALCECVDGSSFFFSPIGFWCVILVWAWKKICQPSCLSNNGEQIIIFHRFFFYFRFSLEQFFNIEKKIERKKSQLFPVNCVEVAIIHLKKIFDTFDNVSRFICTHTHNLRTRYIFGWFFFFFSFEFFSPTELFLCTFFLMAASIFYEQHINCTNGRRILFCVCPIDRFSSFRANEKLCL